MVRQTVLENYNEGGYRVYRVPSIICTRKGTLIACYECRYGGDWSAMDLALRRSTDAGGTWSERKLIVRGQGIDVIHNAILFADGLRVHLLWHRNYRELYHMFSDDEGATWSAPRDISDAYLGLRERYPWTVVAAGPGHGLTASDGRLLVPVWVSANREDITSHHPSVVTVLYSADHGEHWGCGDIIPASPDFVDPNESVLAQRPDGSFLINSRHETGVPLRKVGYSPDGIHGWHGFTFEEQLPDPVCAAGMTQGEGKIWFVNCNCTREEGRIRLTVRQSDDGGATWPRRYELARTGGYSDICYRAENQTLYVLAETGRADEQATFSFGLSVFALSCRELHA